MGVKLVRKSLVLGIIFLFLGTGFIQCISANSENNVKDDLLINISKKNSLTSSGNGVLIAIGNFKVINSNYVPQIRQYYIRWNSTSGFIFGFDINTYKIKFETLGKGTIFTTTGSRNHRDAIFDFYVCSAYSFYE